MVIALALLAYGAYAVLLMVAYESIWFLLWAAPCFVGGVGLAMSRAWSQYLLYVVATCTVAGWAAFVAISWSGLEVQTIMKLFALGFGLILFSVWSGVVVFRRFHRHGS